jgi:hypothetical protein
MSQPHYTPEFGLLKRHSATSPHQVLQLQLARQLQPLRFTTSAAGSCHDRLSEPHVQCQSHVQSHAETFNNAIVCTYSTVHVSAPAVSKGASAICPTARRQDKNCLANPEPRAAKREVARSRPSFAPH